MSSRSVQQHVAELTGSSEGQAGDLETLIRQKMRLHPLVHVTCKFGLLPRAARTLGHYAGLASNFCQQLFAPKQRVSQLLGNGQKWLCGHLMRNSEDNKTKRYVEQAAKAA